MGAMNSLATVGLNLAAAQRTQATEEDRLAEEQDRRAQDLLARAAEDARQSEQVLKRRLAQERARAGASGVGSTGGSIDAVLRGLAEEDETDRTSRQAELESKLAQLRDGYDTRRRKSLLDLNSSWLDAGSRTLSGLGRRRRLLG